MSPTRPDVFETIASFRHWRKQLSASAVVGFVPTMGALHAGHARLLEEARHHCSHVVLSIFVNPTQFGANEDLSKYPRTWEADLQLAQQMGVDAIFHPSAPEIYPDNYSTYVTETYSSKFLCGPFRPGHFQGVTTVVLKLFNVVQPHLAYFGMKDAQQFFVLSKMTRDLNVPVELKGIGTVREKDGLAMSSRNRYLSEAERKLAPMLYDALQMVQKNLLPGKENLSHILAETRKKLAQHGFVVQYLEALTIPDLTPLSTDTPAKKPTLIAIAAFLGTTRLIDNIVIDGV